MSLNADADRDYGPVDDNIGGPIITTPPDNGASSNQVTADQLFDAPVVAGELPTFSGEIHLNERRQTCLTDLAYMRRDLKVQGTVSVEDAAALDTIAPGFISDDRPLALFSQDRTRTQYAETLQSVNAYVDRNHAELKDSVLNLAARVFSAAAAVDESFRCSHVVALTAINKALVQLLIASEATDVPYVRYTFNNRMRWGQFLKLDLHQVIGDGVSDSSQQQSTTGFEGTLAQPFLERYAEILKNTDTRYNLECLNAFNRDPAKFRVWLGGNRYSIAEGILQPNIDTEGGPEEDSGLQSKATSIGAFIELVGDSRLRDFVKLLQSVYTNQLNILQQIPGQVAQLEAQTDANLQARVDALVELSSMVNRAHHQMQGIVFILCGIFQFMEVTRDLIVALTKTQTVVSK